MTRFRVGAFGPTVSANSGEAGARPAGWAVTLPTHKTLDSETRVRFSGWRYSLSVVTHGCQEKRGSWVLGALPDSTLCTSTCGWFYSVSF